MRLWTLHPRHLDSRGLVALWREALLAKAVLSGQTKGYRQHPQLQRFRDAPDPLAAINAYLAAVYEESRRRSYNFDRTKFTPVDDSAPIRATRGQLAYEFQHLLLKLMRRSPADYDRLRSIPVPDAHPLFEIRPGPIEPWERIA